MNFDNPTFVKPDSATINDINYSDVYIGGLKIGTLLKSAGKYHLEVMFNKYEFKTSESSRIIPTINMEYARTVLHVLGSIESKDLDKWKQLMNEKTKVK